jgi:protein-S-isoprenylcysteine O-methyltransferase Ste14
MAPEVQGVLVWRFRRPDREVVAVAYSPSPVWYLWSNLVMAVHGEGTPLFLDGPRKLVIAGPYRHVRNPMTLALLAQSLAVGLWLGSPLVLLSFVPLAAFELFVIQPSEIVYLERRFGDAYRRYRLRVAGWRVWLHGYDPVRQRRAACRRGAHDAAGSPSRAL